MPNRKSVFLLNNLVSKDYVTVFTQTGSTFVPASLPLSNAKTEEPSKVSRITTTDPFYSWWGFNFGGIEQSELGAFAAVNINLSPAGSFRFLLSAGTTFEYIKTAPNAIAASTNATGAVTNVDEDISSPDANYITPTDPDLDWSVRLTFPTPSAAPTTGDQMAFFVLNMRRVASAGTTTLYPVVTVDLYESGAFVRTLGYRAVSESSNQRLIFTFNPAELAAPNCSNVEVLITATPGGGSGGDYYAQLNTAILYTDQTGAFPSTYLYDTGWLSSPNSTFTDPQAAPPPNTNAQHFAFPSNFLPASFHAFLLVLDDQAYRNPPTFSDSVPIGVIRQPPSGFVEVGYVVISGGLYLTHGIPYGSGPAHGPDAYQQGGVGAAGNSFGADAYRQNSVDYEFILTRDEKDQLMFGLDYQLGKSGAFYFAEEPDVDLKYQIFNSGLFTAEELGKAVPFEVAYNPGGEMLYRKRYVFKEKL